MENQTLTHPASWPLVTFDNNVIISLRNKEADALPARQLLALSRAGEITAATTLSTALEKQGHEQKLTMHEYDALQYREELNLAL